MKPTNQSNTFNAGRLSRRDFIKTSAASAASAAVLLAGSSRAYAAGADTIRIGLIGCGGRGTGATLNAFSAAENIELVALADVFPDRLNKARDSFKEKLGDACKVTDDTAFQGFDAFQKLINLEQVNYVILATPPHFRPEHFAAAINAGKNVFTEKPVAVDPVGIRSFIKSGELAQQKGLAVVAGTQRRHQACYQDIIRRIHDGQIGEIVGGQVYWMCGGLWSHPREPNWSDMEYQLRNWLYYTWLSGDHIVEQHVHNIDIMNWAMGAHPVKCLAMGGRQVRTQEIFGNIFDHFAVEFEYPNGARVNCKCQQIDGCPHRVNERIVGAKGIANESTLWDHQGQVIFKHEQDAQKDKDPYIQEHADLIASIRNGQPLNEARQVAESTMSAIMGRMSAYTGRELSWDWVMNASKLELGPQAYEFGPLPVMSVAVPGQTKLV